MVNLIYNLQSDVLLPRLFITIILLKNSTMGPFPSPSTSNTRMFKLECGGYILTVKLLLIHHLGLVPKETAPLFYFNISLHEVVIPRRLSEITPWLLRLRDTRLRRLKVGIAGGELRTNLYPIASSAQGGDTSDGTFSLRF